jgi:general secretion pathway protein K
MPTGNHSGYGPPGPYQASVARPEQAGGLFPPPGPRPPRSRGSALLMVLWVSAALAAIGFSLASTVRGEAERASTAVDGLRSYYLAVGGLQRAMIELLWSTMYGTQRVIPKGSAAVDYNFPSGVVHVEIIPETAKLDVNHVPVPELMRLLTALGVPPGRVDEIAAAIEDWRNPGGGGFDSYYSAQIPSFRAPHASFHEIEELLLVKGMTPDLFYGTYVPLDPGEVAEGGPRLVPRGGLIDCLTVYGSDGRVDANTAAPGVLAAIGLDPYAIGQLVARRSRVPFTEQTLPEFLGSIGAAGSRLRVEGNYIVTLRATARLRTPAGISDLKRTVGAQVRYLQPNSPTAVNVLRWYDTAWSN